MKLEPNRSVMLLVAVALLALAVVPSGALAKSCAKRGYSLEQMSSSTVLMSKPYRDRKNWEGTAYTYYVCSRRYGKRVGIGTYGLSFDGEIAFSNLLLSNRFAGYAWGTSNNAGSVSDEGLEVVDLKSGQSRSISIDNSSADTYVTKIALDASGAIGWIDEREENGVDVAKVWLSPHGAKGEKRLFASGAEIDREFLKFGYREGKNQLIWTSAVSGADL